MKNLGKFLDNNNQHYTLFRVSSNQLSKHIQDIYKKGLKINDFDQFIFESDGYGDRKKKIFPEPRVKKFMMEQGFVCLNSPGEISPFASDIILLDGFNRLINGEVPEQDIFVKVYHNMPVDEELRFYYEANAHKTYKYNAGTDVTSQFIDRGFLLYLTLRTGIQWTNRTRKLLENYFDSSGYNYRHASSERSHLLHRMIYDNPFFIKDIDFIIYLDGLNNDIIELEMIKLLGAFRAHELFGNKLGDYAKEEFGNKKDLSGAKIGEEFSRELVENFLNDELVLKTMKKLETAKNKEDIQISMWEHFIASFFLPHYAGVEVELSKGAKKDKVKREKGELFKTMDIVKFPKDSGIAEEREYFKIGETYKLYCENEDASEYKIIDVVYKGINKKIRSAGVVMTVERPCHIFFSEELKEFDLRDRKNFAGGMWSKWQYILDAKAGEYSANANHYWNSISKNNKMYIIADKKNMPSKKLLSEQ